MKQQGKYKKTVRMENNTTLHALLHKALAHFKQARYTEAHAIYHQLAQQYPTEASVFYNHGCLYQCTHELEKAEAAFKRALTLHPHMVEAYNNLGNTLRELGRYQEAQSYLEKAIALDPHYPRAHLNLGITLLTQGALPQGWLGYEWRHQVYTTRPDFPQPLWEGAHHPTESLLISAEQGFGDTLQFIRYLPQVKKYFQHVFLQVQTPLWRLLASNKVAHCVLAWGQGRPAFHRHITLPSLPALFKTTFHNLPPPYPLRAPADPTPLEIQTAGKKPRIGFVWRGNPDHPNDHNRSIPLHHFIALAQQCPGVFYSFQGEKGKESLTQWPKNLPLYDLSPYMMDFAATAALVLSMDVILTADTAMAHLAASLGKPVFTLLPYVPDWRWLTQGSATPWYPTMTLLRQPAPSQWAPVFAQLAKKLL